MSDPSGSSTCRLRRACSRSPRRPIGPALETGVGTCCSRNGSKIRRTLLSSLRVDSSASRAPRCSRPFDCRGSARMRRGMAGRQRASREVSTPGPPPASSAGVENPQPCGAPNRHRAAPMHGRCHGGLRAAATVDSVLLRGAKRPPASRARPRESERTGVGAAHVSKPLAYGDPRNHDCLFFGAGRRRGVRTLRRRNGAAPAGLIAAPEGGGVVFAAPRLQRTEAEN